MIAIYGANGHTGRLVAAELLDRGQEVVLAGRNFAALHALADELGDADRGASARGPVEAARAGSTERPVEDGSVEGAPGEGGLVGGRPGEGGSVGSGPVKGGSVGGGPGEGGLVGGWPGEGGSVAGGLGVAGRVRVKVAALDDPAGLRELTESVSVLIHCAGPFAQTCEPLAAAAVAGGCHYVDHAVEPHPVKYLFDHYQAPAERAGIVMIPQLSFYGGLADLLASAVASGLEEVDRLTVGYSIAGWRMTPAAVKTAELLIGEIDRITYTDGAQHVGPVEIRNTVFPFPPPVGPRTMIAPFPSGEVVTIPRHVPARTVESQLTSSTFEDERTFTSQDATPAERADSDFVVAVQATAVGGGGRNGHIRGRDIWRAGVLASVEGAIRLADGDGPKDPGVLPAAEAFPAEPFLRTLESLSAFTLTL